jgi:hypothetical protein
MARAAGLLSERQRITDAKVFRRAKILLGIRSIQMGSGHAADGRGSYRAIVRKARLDHRRGS